MKNILIVGGYGEVGRRTAAHLLQNSKTTVTLAGRSLKKAQVLAAQLGSRATPLQLDSNDLTGVQKALEPRPLVVNCVDLQELHLIYESARRGLTLIDATASYGYWQRVFPLKAQVEERGARVLLGAGLIPGITNVMAKAAHEALGGLTRLQTNTLLSISSSHGEAATTYTLSEAGQTYHFPAAPQPERSFVQHKTVDFGGDVGRMIAYRFPFPSQFFYRETLDAEASSYLALGPAWVGTLLSASIRLGGQPLLQTAWLKSFLHRVTPLLSKLPGGTPKFLVAVDAVSPTGHRRYRLEGRDAHQSEATALGIVAMLEQFDAASLPPGIWLPEQWVEPEPFFGYLKTLGLRVLVE